jgi:hypothetical protein
MAQFQYRSGSRVPSAITHVVGSLLPLKLIPAVGERVPIGLTLTPGEPADFEDVTVRPGPNFTTFSVRAVRAGRTVLAANATTVPIAINIVERIALPAANTPAGLYARVFLAETKSPGVPANRAYSDESALESMVLMRVVIDNRLRNPSSDWASNGARTLADVIRRPGQFEGFGSYPDLSSRIQDNIDKAIAIANDGAHPRSAAYRSFVSIALTVAQRSAIPDPSGTGLYFWRTAESGSPSPRVELYRSVLGNSFYRMKRN